MKALFLVLFLFVFAGLGLAQSTPGLDKIKDTQVLVSKREDVNRLLRDYLEFSHAASALHESFSLENVNIAFRYSSGNCSDDSEEWNVPPSVVTSITITPKDDLAKEKLGVDLSKFRKQRTDPQRKRIYVLHDKARGMAIGVFGSRIDTVYLFPGSESYSLLCDKREVKAYYKSKRWTREPVPKNLIIDYNRPANVVGLTMAREEADSRRFVVLVDAKDAENDILTYNYRVSAGKIIGTGKKVVWDLIEASPGTYTLTAGVNDGCGICGKTISRTVVVE